MIRLLRKGYVRRLEQLAGYVDHRPWCGRAGGMPDCTCGLAELPGELERDVAKRGAR